MCAILISWSHLPPREHRLPLRVQPHLLPRYRQQASPCVRAVRNWGRKVDCRDPIDKGKEGRARRDAVPELYPVIGIEGVTFYF